MTNLNEGQKVALNAGAIADKEYREAKRALRARIEERVRAEMNEAAATELAPLKRVRDYWAWSAREAGVPVSRIASDMLSTTNRKTAMEAITAGERCASLAG